MRMVDVWMCGETGKDKNKNKHIGQTTKVKQRRLPKISRITEMVR